MNRESMRHCAWPWRILSQEKVTNKEMDNQRKGGCEHSKGMYNMLKQHIKESHQFDLTANNFMEDVNFQWNPEKIISLKHKKGKGTEV